jgi:tRNA-dihydrouridine synthase B
MAPFVSTVKGKIVKNQHIRDLLPEYNRNLPLVPQIIGNNPQDFVALCVKLFDLGYREVNWNIGCPFPQVTKKKRGAGLLPYPDRIKSFLDHVVTRIPNKLSIKTRLGLASKEEMQGWMPVLNGFPIVELIVHARTGKQLYSGEADLDGFKEAVRSSAHPVVYNGDIVSRESFEALRLRFPTITEWMIGRGALANPFLGEIIKGKEPSIETMYSETKAFHDDLLSAYTEVLDNSGYVVDKMKGIWLYLSQLFPEGKTLLKSIQKSRRMDQYNEVVQDIFLDH